MDKQKQLGQYFTTNKDLLSNLYKFIHNTTGSILEPSFGQGDVIQHLLENGNTRKIVGIEIDTTIKPIVNVNDNVVFKYEDFLKFETTDVFSSIIGNPPYFKLKDNPNTRSILGTTNIYVAFIEKAFHLLDDNGELVFIIPSDFFKLTSASKLKELMVKHGSFTDIYHPHKENLFSKAAQDVIIFRYQKCVFTETIRYNGEDKKVICSKGNIYFRDTDCNVEQLRVDDVFEIKVGMVSGAEKVFANKEFGNVVVYTASGFKRQIMIEQINNDDDALVKYLLQFRQQLQERKIKKFNDHNWFQWGCLRNKKFMEEKKGKDCIYAKVLTRNVSVFQKGQVDYYDGSLLCLYPKKELHPHVIDTITQYLNTKDFLQHFLYSGRYKVGQKTLSDAFIPKHILEH
jgi:adenine-specific DNA-methyltransferase